MIEIAKPSSENWRTVKDTRLKAEAAALRKLARLPDEFKSKKSSQEG